uniref:Uncharacterized protein n=1 Tax=Octopus bimaculoides TaxID=37653 RepID=A0A0L8GX73_OCTBM
MHWPKYLVVFNYISEIKSCSDQHTFHCKYNALVWPVKLTKPEKLKTKNSVCHYLPLHVLSQPVYLL